MGYNLMVEDAMRSVVRRALNMASETALPGDHHFYITFRTDLENVILPAHLHARYPREMTIVLQHQFWNLDVSEELIEVDLSFNQRRERLRIPMDALITFADPSVNFAVQFSNATSALEDDEAEEAGQTADANSDSNGAGMNGDVGAVADSDSDAEVIGDGNVVALDAFRKK